MQETKLKTETGIVIDSVFMQHRPPSNHPESPGRIETLLSKIKQMEIEFQTVPLRKATENELTLVHTLEHIEYIKRRLIKTKDLRHVPLDADTWLSIHSYETALYAAGSSLELGDRAMKKEIQYSMALVRPPGHHALTYRAMGFCLFNNIALLARYLLKNYDIKKVAIVDFDVHHGNGSQQIFYHNNNVLTISMHQYPFWPPQSGWFDQPGEGAGEGFNVNIPMIKFSGDLDYYIAFKEIILPAISQYEPDVILVAAGYDAHKDDFIADINLSSGFFSCIYHMLINLDTRIPIISTLEGGYNFEANAESVAMCLQTLHNKKATVDPMTYINTSNICNPVNNDFLEQTRSFLSNYWNVS
jgi:acetoin utilization deacetylase AcuC-like enzyme